MVKNQPANAGDVRDVDLIPGSGRSPGERSGNLLQYSCLGNSIDRGAWWTSVHGVTKSWARLNSPTHTHRDIFSTLHLTTAEHTFFSSVHETSSRLDHTLGHKSQ